MSDNNHNMNCCVPRSVVYYIVRALNACTAVAYTNTHIHTATIHPVPSPNCRNNGLAAFTCRAVSEKKNSFEKNHLACPPSRASLIRTDLNNLILNVHPGNFVARQTHSPNSQTGSYFLFSVCVRCTQQLRG